VGACIVGDCCNRNYYQYPGMEKSKPLVKTAFQQRERWQITKKINFKEGVNKMREVRNSDGRLVCRIDESTDTVIQISIKNCVTLIKLDSNGKVEITNTKKAS